MAKKIDFLSQSYWAIATATLKNKQSSSIKNIEKYKYEAKRFDFSLQGALWMRRVAKTS